MKHCCTPVAYIMGLLWWWFSGQKFVCNAGDTEDDASSIPGSGRPHKEVNDSPLQYSYLGNPKDREREAWWATVHGVTKELVWLRD